MAWLIGWGFAYFVWLKIYTAFVFDDSLSVLGALVIAIVITAIQTPVMFVWNNIVRDQLLSAYGGNPRPIPIFGPAILFTAWVAASTVASAFVAMGFSKRFYDRVLTAWPSGLNVENMSLFALGIAIFGALELMLLIWALSIKKREIVQNSTP